MTDDPILHPAQTQNEDRGKVTVVSEACSVGTSALDRKRVARLKHMKSSIEESSGYLLSCKCMSE